MAKLYPTVHNKTQDFGVPSYEIRGDKLYPTVHNKTQDFGVPSFEVR
jgi:hypothetical protein